MRGPLLPVIALLLAARLALAGGGDLAIEVEDRPAGEVLAAIRAAADRSSGWTTRPGA